MLASMICWCLCGFFVSWLANATAVNLELNRDSTIYHDIKSVTHDAARRNVVIEMKPFRRCGMPSFRVRLSGASLYMLDLVKHDFVPQKKGDLQNHSPLNNYVYGYPPVQDTGSYFIEVIVMYCSSINPESYADMCAEDVQGGRNVVTLPYSFTVDGAAENAETQPRWVWSGSLIQRNLKIQPGMLPTRYQKRNCPDTGYCKATTADLTHHNQYEWRHQPNHHTALERVISMAGGLHPGQTINVCLIGASHTRHLKDQAVTIGMKGVLIIHILSQYPNTFDIDWLGIFECSYAVITYGQWPLGAVLKGAFPYTMVQYEAEIRDIMAQIKASKTTAQVFFSSSNYNGLGAMYTSCPPIDHRYPPIIDMVNDIMKRLAAEYRMQYINLNHIIGPLWDGALDWGHPSTKVFVAEAQWVFHTMFSYSIAQQKPPHATIAGHVFKENTVLKFSDNATYYLYSRGVIRPFPDVRTLQAMMFETKSAKLFSPNAKLYVKKGLPLPQINV